jgi:predicted DNA-binding transcriptional regulator AlpA
MEDHPSASKLTKFKSQPVEAVDYAVIRKAELLRLVPLSDNTILKMELAGSFPRRFKIGSKTVGWRRAAVFAWIDARQNSAGGSGR